MEVSNRNCLCNEVVLWKSGEMKSDWWSSVLCGGKWASLGKE